MWHDKGVVPPLSQCDSDMARVLCTLVLSLTHVRVWYDQCVGPPGAVSGHHYLSHLWLWCSGCPHKWKDYQQVCHHILPPSSKDKRLLDSLHNNLLNVLLATSDLLKPSRCDGVSNVWILVLTSINFFYYLLIFSRLLSQLRRYRAI